ncbi:septum formation inhibitor [Bacillus coahuilensis m2-6]|uniref:septum site-determining protein MinC n=1 Tax=Bacillus coahuilensis TaxID=408580 RepID=UPI0007500ADC|nr:septum site-determining protein MinC [Bacillus coahuilensis]KUP06961.1 septum formation inhibitor [Bacillus coahuilensis m2-6]
MKKKPHVMIKGTKDGLILHLSDTCSMDELVQELDQKLASHSKLETETPLLSVKIQTGNRYLTENQKEDILTIVRHKRNLVVDEITSNVMTNEEANKLKEENHISSKVGVIRSGQVLEVPGDLLLIGDVNPGGTVLAGGNIYIMGALKGIAHAGYAGSNSAVIVASKMVPNQLRIATHVNRAQMKEALTQEMECAYVNEENQIVIDRLQVLKQLRPQITSLVGGY